MTGTDGQPGIGDGMRLSASAFGFLGGLVVLAGVGSILLGTPSAARELTPLAGIGEIGRRLSELALPLCAAGGAAVAIVISVLLALRRLRGRAAAVELLVLSAAIEVSVVAAAQRIAYAADGSVLPAAVACLAGGAAVLVAAFATAASED